MALEARARPGPVGRRGKVVLALLAAGAAAFALLGLAPGELVPDAGRGRIAREFFAAALAPALDYEAADLPAGIEPFPLVLARSLQRTVFFAAAAMGISILAGGLLGVLASGSWWSAGGGRRPRIALSLQWSARCSIAGMRSVHELLWAVVLLAALGLESATAVLAIAIPYAGTLAKVFSEMLDEAPGDSAEALRGLGARPAAVFLFGQLPRALPDMAAYAFYRFECAVRSSAILGFFGFETAGHFLRAAFEDRHYREVWSYLYALGALVLLLEAWSAALRKRFVA